MIFRLKFLIAGMAPASKLYETLKNELEMNIRYQIGDVFEAEVIETYQESNNQIRPIVPVTFKIVTYGYESDASVLFDIYMSISDIQHGEIEGVSYQVGLEEIVVDGERVLFPRGYMLGELPLVEL